LNKGTAVMRLAEKHILKSAIYLGDDATDIDAFVALRQWRIAGSGNSLSVAVLSPESKEMLVQNADAHAKGVEDVEGFLARLADLAARQAWKDPQAGGKAT
ncbi:MAG: hypothetical protein Q7O66_01355, partial [Dehalococcoidia bacterium]|nr:hypothetical protein [Dehalococcoidia bacterium]